MNNINYKPLLLVVFLGFSLFFSVVSEAQVQLESSVSECKKVEQCRETIARYKRDQAKLKKAYIEMKGKQLNIKNLDSARKLSTTYNDYQISLYNRNIKFHSIQIEAFRQQALHSWFSLFVISVIMTAGLVFAGIQLYFSYKYGKNVEQSESSIQMGNLSFKSSVLGVTVLFIWLISYFIYVEKIYPIDTVNVMSKIQNAPIVVQ